MYNNKTLKTDQMEIISDKQKKTEGFNEVNPKIRTKPNGGVFFMKLSYEDKVRMYHSWKQHEKSPKQLAKEYGVAYALIE